MPSLKGQVAFNLEIHQILISLLIAGSVTARVLSLLGPSFPEGVVGPKAKVTLRRFFRQKEIHPRQTRARPGLCMGRCHVRTVPVDRNPLHNNQITIDPATSCGLQTQTTLGQFQNPL